VRNLLAVRARKAIYDLPSSETPLGWGQPDGRREHKAGGIRPTWGLHQQVRRVKNQQPLHAMPPSRART